MLASCFDIAYNISMKGVVFMAQAVNVNFKLDADVKRAWNRLVPIWGFP